MPLRSFGLRIETPRYQKQFIAVFAEHSGTLLAADEAPQVIEGDWDREKVVLMSFPNETLFHEMGFNTGELESLRGREDLTDARVRKCTRSQDISTRRFPADPERYWVLRLPTGTRFRFLDSISSCSTSKRSARWCPMIVTPNGA